MEEQLVRHAKVSERIGLHPSVAENLSTCPGPDGHSWWLVDRWESAETLADRLATGPLGRDELPELMKALAEGLRALHAAGVVMRELAPRRVLLAETDQRPILTDFELAKLLDASPTVSKDWPEDPYRAPEVASGTADVRSDLYSWARIFVHAATGTLPAPGDDASAVTAMGLPKAVWKTTVACLSPGPSARPASVDELQRALARW